jgi:hypothetical protein
VTDGLDAWEEQHGDLPGLVGPGRRDAFVGQLVDSDRRRRYLEHFRTSDRLTPGQADPASGVFDAHAAAVLRYRAGDLDDALWLVFLATHIGHHPRAKWAYIGRVYGGLGGGRWDWDSVVADLAGFDSWLHANAAAVKQGPGGFGNHRKYESLIGTGVVAASYVQWIDPGRGHERAIEEITAPACGVQADEFELLYESMRSVHRFGRLARLDYLTTAGRLGLISAVAGRPYLPESTGPLAGARLLLGAAAKDQLEARAIELGNCLGVGFAVLEDAICNWQKTPDVFKHFRG